MTLQNDKDLFEKAVRETADNLTIRRNNFITTVDQTVTVNVIILYNIILSLNKIMLLDTVYYPITKPLLTPQRTMQFSCIKLLIVMFLELDSFQFCGWKVILHK